MVLEKPWNCLLASNQCLFGQNISFVNWYLISLFRRTMSCLSLRPPDDILQRYGLQRPVGQHWTALRQCQLVFGPMYKPSYIYRVQSYVLLVIFISIKIECLWHVFQQSLLCRRLCCYNPLRHSNRFQCFSKTGFPEGTSCGYGKVGTCPYFTIAHIYKDRQTLTCADQLYFIN